MRLRWQTGMACACLLLTLAAHAASLTGLQRVADRDTAYGDWVAAPRTTLWATTDSPLHWSKLEILAYTHAHPAPYALVLHGAMSGVLFRPGHMSTGGTDNLCAILYAMGFNVYALHRRGYDNSEGPSAEEIQTARGLDTAGFIKETDYDLSAAIKLIEKQPGVIPVGVVAGHSFGGLESVHLADTPWGQHLVGSINLAGGYSFIHKDGATSLPLDFFRQYGMTHKAALFIYSDTDWINPVSFVRSWFSLLPDNPDNRLVFVKTLSQIDGHDGITMGDGADHWMGPLQDFVLSLVGTDPLQMPVQASAR